MLHVVDPSTIRLTARAAMTTMRCASIESSRVCGGRSAVRVCRSWTSGSFLDLPQLVIGAHHELRSRRVQIGDVALQPCQGTRFGLEVTVDAAGAAGELGIGVDDLHRGRVTRRLHRRYRRHSHRLENHRLVHISPIKIPSQAPLQRRNPWKWHTSGQTQRARAGSRSGLTFRVISTVVSSESEG
jgi:hypothetical protein